MSQELSFDRNAKSPAHLLKRVNGVQRVFLFYDPDIFTQDLKVSVSLLTGTEDIPGTYHYNTTHTPAQPYSDGILVRAVPPSTKIIGLRRVEPQTACAYYIPHTYDTDDQYSYAWEVEDGEATIVETGAKSISLIFGQQPHNLTLLCTVTDALGGFRQLRTLIHVGNQPKKMLVVRGTKFNEE